MPNKPATVPQLDSNSTNRTIPAPSKVTDGFLLNDILPASNVNYLWGWAGDWLGWLDAQFGDGANPADLVLPADLTVNGKTTILNPGTLSPTANAYALDVAYAYSAPAATHKAASISGSCTATPNSRNLHGLIAYAQADYASGTGNYYTGLYGGAYIGAGAAGVLNHAQGFAGDCSINAAGTGTINNAYVFYAWNGGAGGGTLNNYYGFYCDNITAGGVSNYGLYIAGASTDAIKVADGRVTFDGTDNPTGLIGQLDYQWSYRGLGVCHRTTNATTHSWGSVVLAEIDAATGTYNYSDLHGGIAIKGSANAGTVSVLWGEVDNKGTGTINNATAIEGGCYNGSTGSITDAAVYRAYDGSAGGGSIGTYTGLWVQNIDCATTNYGVYLQGADTAAIFVASGESYLVDAATIGATALSSMNWNPRKLGAEWAPGTTGVSGNTIVGLCILDGVSAGSLDFGGINGHVGLTTSATTGTVRSTSGGYAQTDTSHGAGCTITNAYGYSGWVGNRGTGAITNAAGLYLYGNSNYSTGSITNSYGIYVENQTAGATNYGLRIIGANPGYSIYVDSGYSRFIGPVAMDEAAPSDLVSLYIKKTASGAAAINPVYSYLDVDAASTGTMSNVFLNNRTTHGTGTVNNLRGVQLNSYKTGAGALTNLHGFRHYLTLGDAGTIASLTSFSHGGSVNSPVTVTASVAFQAENLTTTGTLTTQYGLRVTNLTSGTTNYGVRIEGASPGYALYVDSGVTYLGGGNQLILDGPTGNAIEFQEAGAERWSIRQDAVNKLHFDWAGASKAVFDGSGSVGRFGVGTEAPRGQLHVSTGDAGVTPHTQRDDFVIDSTGDVGMTIATGASGRYGGLAFGKATTNNDQGGVTYDHQLEKMYLTANNAIRVTIDGTGPKVGVNTQSPDVMLHVWGSNGAGSFAGNTLLGVESSGDVYMSIMSGATSYGGLLFADSGSTQAGRLRYDHNSNTMELWTAGSEHFNIDNAGRMRGVSYLLPIVESSLDAELTNTGSSIDVTTLATIPANTLTDGAVIEIDLGMEKGDAFGGLTVSVIKLGGATICDLQPSGVIPYPGVGMLVTIRCSVLSTGTTGTVAVMSHWVDSLGTAGADFYRSVTINTTTALALTYEANSAGADPHLVWIPVATVKTAV